MLLNWDNLYHSIYFWFSIRGIYRSCIDVNPLYHHVRQDNNYSKNIRLNYRLFPLKESSEIRNLSFTHKGNSKKILYKLYDRWNPSDGSFTNGKNVCVLSSKSPTNLVQTLHLTCNWFSAWWDIRRWSTIVQKISTFNSWWSILFIFQSKVKTMECHHRKNWVFELHHITISCLHDCSIPIFAEIVINKPLKILIHIRKYKMYFNVRAIGLGI